MIREYAESTNRRRVEREAHERNMQASRIREAEERAAKVALFAEQGRGIRELLARKQALADQADAIIERAPEKNAYQRRATPEGVPTTAGLFRRKLRERVVYTESRPVSVGNFPREDRPDETSNVVAYVTVTKVLPWHRSKWLRRDTVVRPMMTDSIEVNLMRTDEKGNIDPASKRSQVLYGLAHDIETYNEPTITDTVLGEHYMPEDLEKAGQELEPFEDALSAIQNAVVTDPEAILKWGPKE